MAKKTTFKPGAGDASIAASVDAALKPPKGELGPPEGTRAMFTLSAGALHQLDTMVLVDGKDRSAIVEDLITERGAKYFSGKHSAAAEG